MEEIMKPEQFTELTRSIVEANGDQGKITALLTQLQDGYSKLFATHASVTDTNEKLSGENDRLKEYNMNLFLQLGQQVTDTNKSSSEREEKSRAETITCDDLFKEE